MDTRWLENYPQAAAMLQREDDVLLYTPDCPRSVLSMGDFPLTRALFSESEPPGLMLSLYTLLASASAAPEGGSSDAPEEEHPSTTPP